MLKYLFKTFFLIVFLSCSAAGVYAQSEASTPNGRLPRKEELPKNIQESLEKRRIEQEKKDYEELIQKAEEATKMATELNDSFAKQNSLTAEDRKKLEKLERLLKKIRKEMGGDDDDSDENADGEDNEKPATVSNALNKLASTSVNLLDELKKTSRFSISVIAVQSSNAILRVIRFLRFSN